MSIIRKFLPLLFLACASLAHAYNAPTLADIASSSNAPLTASFTLSNNPNNQLFTDPTITLADADSAQFDASATYSGINFALIMTVYDQRFTGSPDITEQIIFSINPTTGPNLVFLPNTIRITLAGITSNDPYVYLEGFTFTTGAGVFNGNTYSTTGTDVFVASYNAPNNTFIFTNTMGLNIPSGSNFITGGVFIPEPSTTVFVLAAAGGVFAFWHKRRKA